MRRLRALLHGMGSVLVIHPNRTPVPLVVAREGWWATTNDYEDTCDHLEPTNPPPDGVIASTTLLCGACWDEMHRMLYGDDGEAE